MATDEAAEPAGPRDVREPAGAGRLPPATKIIGYFIVALGLALQALDLGGYFANEDRASLYRRIERAETVERGTPGFEEFIVAFPPPDEGMPPGEVTHLRSENLIGAGGISAAVDVRYLAGSRKSARVAGLADAAAWAAKTSYGWLSFSVTLAGALVALIGDLPWDGLRRRRIVAAPHEESEDSK